VGDVGWEEEKQGPGAGPTCQSWPRATACARGALEWRPVAQGASGLAGLGTELGRGRGAEVGPHVRPRREGLDLIPFSHIFSYLEFSFGL
jgi:hypothetical protein